jgi:DNA-binding SARP family transcriptional activator/tetratricopeptide (TPR) repeat protein
MELQLLGAVELRSCGRLVDAGPPRQRCVLAALAVDVGRPVLVETVVDRVWGEHPPQRVREAVYVYVTRIRKLIDEANNGDGADGALVRRSRGYVLDLDPDQVDVHRFRRLVRQAREPAVPEERRLVLLRAALDLWRGTPLAGVPGDWAAAMRARCQQEHVDAATAWADAELGAGNSAGVAGPLAALVERHPLAESLVAALMRALHAAGTSAQALELYRQTRDRLVEDLGVEPGPELQDVHQAILRGDLDAPQPARARLATGSASPGLAGSGPARPAQLPPDVSGFTGRARELARLDAILEATDRQPTAVVISAVCGTAGVGKTALAIHWAHRVRARFPDGQLYVNLRGFHPAGLIMSPAEALRGFLDAFETAPERIPANLESQVALYRSMMADRRILVVLDNARDAEQVRPLLPGAPGCLVVVSSRNQLTSLVAAEGAHPLTLDLLTDAEARQMLAHRVGADTTATEPRAAAEIITRCARLPLALAIVAARAATHPAFPLAALATELRETRGSLEPFNAGEPGTDVRAVFSWSYRTLGPGAARLFRLLGLHPGPDIAIPAAASLAGIPPAHVRPLLAELADRHLVAEHTPGRYTFHDLLRAYAAELVHRHDPQTDRTAAIHRLLDHYLHTAHAGALRLNPSRYAITLAPPEAGAQPEDIADLRQAMAWFIAERPVLLATHRHAVDAGLDDYTWQLAWTLTDFLDRRGHWHEWTAIQRTALTAALRLPGQVAAQAHTYRNLGVAYTRTGHDEEAQICLRRALDLFGTLGDRTGQAHTHRTLGYVAERQARLGEALEHAQHALDLFRAIDDRPGQARALNAVGWLHARLGDHRGALPYCQQAMTLLQELGDRRGEAATWDSLGYVHHRLGDHQQGARCYQHALALIRDVGDRHEEADMLARLGDVHLEAGQARLARDAWQHALHILDELDHPDTYQLRDKLQSLERPLSTHLQRPR